MNTRADTIIARIVRIERATVYSPTVAKDRAIARMWRAFSNAIARA